MGKGISVCHCFGDAPIDRSLPRVKRTRHVGYELFAQLIRNRITDCLVHDRSDVDEGERSGQQLHVIVERGILKSYLLNTYAARKLGLASTGNASRSVGEPSSVGATNFYLAPGTATPEEIIRSVTRGLYVTELIGFGINMVTGDYSRGAVGFWIENGELAYPVEEITIAGNLKDMWMGVEAIGNDLVFRGRIASPTVKIAEMTVAGE